MSGRGSFNPETIVRATKDIPVKLPDGRGTIKAGTVGMVEGTADGVAYKQVLFEGDDGDISTPVHTSYIEPLDMR